MISQIFSFLVYPRDYPGAKINGTVIPHEGKLYDLLSDLYQKSTAECNVEISFNASADGKQENPCREEVIKTLKAKDLAVAEDLAKRLHLVSTNRSGIGLMFVIIGVSNDKDKILLCRFPADHGIAAEEQSSQLKVQFIEKVFMKNSHSYKSVYYLGKSEEADFWSRWAIDKQLNSSVSGISGYWIKDFLLSDFKTTSAAGTKRLAVAMRETANSEVDLGVKQEIASASSLSKVFDGKSVTFESFAAHFGLSDETKELIESKLKKSTLVKDHFSFDHAEFCKHMQYRSVELDTGAIMTATLTSFNDCFKQETLTNDKYRFVAEGNIKSERFRKAKV